MTEKLSIQLEAIRNTCKNAIVDLKNGKTNAVRNELIAIQVGVESLMMNQKKFADAWNFVQ